MAKTPIKVDIKEGSYKGMQRWSYAIDKPGKGSKETKLQRYASASNARRAAAAELKAEYRLRPTMKNDGTMWYWVDQTGREVVFTVKRARK